MEIAITDKERKEGMGGSERLNWMVSCWLLVLVSLVCVHLTPVSAVSLAQSQVVVSDQIATSTSG